MEQQIPQEFILDAFADPASVRDVVRGILHTIFFHRFFPGVTPHSREVLDITLPYVEDAELETMIEKRAAELDRELSAERTHTHSGPNGRGSISVQFFEKKRRKGAWGYMRGGDDEICWESWTVKVTVAEPRTESGHMETQRAMRDAGELFADKLPDRAKVRKAMESTLLNTIVKIVANVNQHKDHIPPITATDVNPFPYQINVNQKDAGWATRIGIY